ncbi:CpsB/CapC family capsule biosynthesis tyrosine phosphatase [Sphaerotilus sp.]|uniref:tyrosine-protein phosphatase n=1 Tax=Sphaerotilus sp. TaxID=2093942 RepID=UPI00286E97B3|nr:CpsB/CapC family capsule biosynthesis tyrosine phosphatase [Sphaerotilus sp.]
MLDLHAHVLPGIDDGPRTMDDAVALARAMAEDGIEHVVVTPHIYPGVFDNTPARIAEAFDLLQAAVSEQDIPLTMSWAAEVRICPEILDWLELRRLPLLNGSLVGPGTVLIELPDGQIPVGTDRLMGMLMEQGITPLMAHPERNKAVMEQLTRLEPLRRLGCKFQLTAGSLLGEFGSRAQTTAQGLLDAGWVDVVATDAHNRSSRRPRLSAARDWLSTHYDSALATQLTQTNPTAITGMTSFTVERGQDRLVFRDLPAAPAPLVQDLHWGDDLFDQSETAAAPPTNENWSLLDFKIDAIHAELTQAVAQMDGPAQKDSSPTPEDWALPSFVGAAAPVPAPSPAPVPKLFPVIDAAIPTLTAAVVREVVPQAPVQTAPPTPPTPPVEAPAVANSQPESPSPAPALAPPTPVQSTPVEVALDPPRGLRLRDMQSVPETALSRPIVQQAPRSTAVVLASSRARPTPAPVQPTATDVPRWTPPGRDSVLTPGGTRGFRLNELPPIPPARRR